MRLTASSLPVSIRSMSAALLALLSLSLAPLGNGQTQPGQSGVGVFYDRVPLGVYSFAQYPDRVVTYYDGSGAVTEGPITYRNGLGEVISRRRFVFTHDAPGNFSPRGTTGSVYIEQPVTRVLRVRAGYLHTVSNGLVILDSTAPNPTSQTAETLLSGNGTGRYRQFDITARVNAGAK